MRMLNGNCTGDENPDWWFPEVPTGRSEPEKIKRVASQINYALQLCATCPVKDECLAEGMKMEKMLLLIYFVQTVNLNLYYQD